MYACVELSTLAILWESLFEELTAARMASCLPSFYMGRHEAQHITLSSFAFSPLQNRYVD
jgi:hypothetical protein